MTPAQNELIRYPVAVMAGAPWNILDAAGMRIAMCGDPGKLGYNHTDTLRAAEIVRVLNAYHDLTSRPAPVAADCEPSAAARKSREKRVQYRDRDAQWLVVHRLAAALQQAAEQGSVEVEVAIDAKTGARVSALLVRPLEQGGPVGVTLAQLADRLEGMGIRKATISATLYNMKKRGEIEHNKQTGRYRLSPRALSRS